MREPVDLVRKKLNILIFGYGNHGKKIKNLMLNENSESWDVAEIMKYYFNDKFHLHWQK